MIDNQPTDVRVGFAVNKAHGEDLFQVNLSTGGGDVTLVILLRQVVAQALLDPGTPFYAMTMPTIRAFATALGLGNAQLAEIKPQLLAEMRIFAHESGPHLRLVEEPAPAKVNVTAADRASSAETRLAESVQALHDACGKSDLPVLVWLIGVLMCVPGIFATGMEYADTLDAATGAEFKSIIRGAVELTNTFAK